MKDTLGRLGVVEEDPQYKKKQSLSSNQSFTNSTQSSALTNQHEIHQTLDQNHINSFLMHYYLSSSSTQFRNQLRMYLILKIIIYSLVCVNICLCVICLYTMDASFGYVEPKFTDNSTSSTTQKSFRNILMNEVLDKLPVYLQEIVSQGQLYTNQTFERVEQKIDIQLSITAEQIIQSLLSSYQLSSVIQLAESITQSLNETTLASQIINSQEKILQQTMNNYIEHSIQYVENLKKILLNY
ncbi:unnamed protein product [Schistosoma turkestanicum]|nr:unnamed protein product [Schistosoma turkestanicum]